MNKLFEWAKLLFGITDTLQELKAEGRKRQEQIEQLITTNRLLVAEIVHSRQVEALEREKLKLEIMNELLRRLPPPPPSPPPAP